MVNKQEVVSISTNFLKFKETQEELIEELLSLSKQTGQIFVEHFYCHDCNSLSLISVPQLSLKSMSYEAQEFTV